MGRKSFDHSEIRCKGVEGPTATITSDVQKYFDRIQGAEA